MENKLTLENIAPFGIGKEGLKIIHNDDDIIRTIQGLHPGSIATTPQKRGFKYMSIGVPLLIKDEFKPILRKMDLCKPITVEGKEIIPIVELFKMAAFREYDDYAHNLFNQMNLKLEPNNWIRVKTGFPQLTELLFKYEYGSFVFKRIEPKYEDIEVIKQLKMFKWLYKHKFDVDGLCEKGLAIDADSLEINPYNI